MTEERVLAPRLTHQRDTGCGAYRQQTAANPGGQSDEQPLTCRHVWIHRQHSEHDGYVVNDR